MLEFEPSSYRDRDSRVFSDGQGGVFRALSPAAWRDWDRLRSSRFFQRAMEDGRIVGTAAAPDTGAMLHQLPGAWAGAIEHERIPVVSHPHEWTFGMLQDAALLQLRLLQEALDEEFTMKDGWAYNVQFRGARPVFIDLGSFEPMTEPRPWAGYRQFCQTFLYPLMLQAYKGVLFQPWLRGRLEGIAPQEFRRLMSWWDLFRPGVWTHVVLHAWLQDAERQTDRNTSRELTASGFHKSMLAANLKRLSQIVTALRWSPPPSSWSKYEESNSYAPADQAAKRAFVRDCLESRRWKLVWDLGCNTGTYSRLAAEYADQVVALDADHLAVERFYQSLKAAGGEAAQRILPLVWNVADQAEGLGWRGRERTGLALRGRPDLILCLAVLHHLVIGQGLPLDEVFQWLAQFRCGLVVEFVDRTDRMVQRLVRRRRDGAGDYDQPQFERALTAQFEILRSQVLPMGTRTLYFAVPKSP